MGKSKTLLKFIIGIIIACIIAYIIYKICIFSTLENFSTRLQDGRSTHRLHPVNIRARWRKWKRTKPFNKQKNVIKRYLNNMIWSITGKRQYF